MQYVFGPVPSRRLGQSLGIDPVPLKTCNWNCVYCQLGRSRPVINERKVYVPTDAVLAEVGEVLEATEPGKIDWITFVASGETTLHARLDELIQGVRAMTELPIAIITNGSLLHTRSVRQALLQADAVMPSLDAGSPELYRRINRPHSSLTFDHHVEGLVQFRREYGGSLWLEIMLIRGLNDTAEALEDLQKIVQRITPDEVHLLLPDRPPVETWVQPPTEDGLMRAMAILGEAAHVVPPLGSRLDLSTHNSPVDAIAEIVQRHPIREDQLRLALADVHSPEEVGAILREIDADERIRSVERHGVHFCVATGSFFPEK